MTKKQFKYDDEALAKIAKGVAKLEKSVGSTLGPKGRTCIISHMFGYPTTTKDGVSVAKEVTLEDPFENMGAQLVRQVASQTAEEAGDGTTTATVLANSMVADGVKAIASGANAVEIKQGMDAAVTILVEKLKKMSHPCSGYKDIKNVGTISSNGDVNIGTTIADAMKEVGEEGVITIEEGSGFKTELEVTKGMQFDKGYLSSYFVTDKTNMKVVFDKPLILLVNDKLDRIRDLLPLLEKINETGRPLMVIANEVEGDALQTLVMNAARGVFKSCAIHSPGFGDYRLDWLQDLAAVTGAKVINQREGYKLNEIKLEYLGECDKAIIDKNTTTLVCSADTDDMIKVRADHIRALLTEEGSQYDHEKLKQRLAKLVGGVAVIKVGAETELEMKERKDRIDDAVCATKAAVEEGIIAGGGSALFKLSQCKLKGVGQNIVLKACEAPLTKLLTNAGKTPEIIKAHIIDNKHIGYNIAKEKYCDLIPNGIIDPVKVTRVALQKAVSVAGLLLTTSTLIHPVEDEVEKSHLM